MPPELHEAYGEELELLAADFANALNNRARGAAGGAWSKWFTRFLRKTVGIEEPKKVFHSFRHTFKDMGREAGLREDVHDALTGHSGGGVGRGYGRGFGLKAMAAEMAKIEVPEAARGLKWSGAGAGEAAGAKSKNR